MQSISRIFIIVITALTLAAPLSAAGNKSQTSDTEVRSADQLIGMEVINRHGEAIGNIKDIKFGSDPARVEQVIISLDAVERDIAAPIDALRFGDGNATLHGDETGFAEVVRETERESEYGVSPDWQENRGSKNIDHQDNFRRLDIERELKNPTRP